MNISVVIITKNEAHNIARCIESCLPLKAEIIVLDSNSTDNTVAIAQGLGARVEQVEWKGYGPTKNYGAEIGSNDWILSLDADEALNEGLQNSIIEITKDSKEVSAYWMRRSLVFLGKTLHYGAVRHETRLRLYNKNLLHWDDKNVHENLVPKNNKDHTYGELQGALLHYSYTDMQDMKMRMDKYAQLSANQLKNKSALTLHIKRILNPLTSFFKNYILNMGFADGRLGYLFAREQANYVFKKYNYAIQHQSRERG